MADNPLSRVLLNKYAFTAWFYDLLDYPWERLYKKWRPQILHDLSGEVLEIGVGTGRNLPYYPMDVRLTAVDLSPAMLKRAQQRVKHAKCKVTFKQEDITDMADIKANTYDWVIGTFVCCVVPNALQAKAIQELQRVLKPGGKFRLLEIIYSQDSKIRYRQERYAHLIEKIYGARFDRQTLNFLYAESNLHVTKTCFLKDDTYLLIEGEKRNFSR